MAYIRMCSDNRLRFGYHLRSHNMLSPIVTRKDFQLIDIDDEGFVTLMDDKLNDRSDLRLDLDGDELHQKIKDMFDEGTDLNLTVLAAMGTEKIIALKENTGNT